MSRGKANATGRTREKPRYVRLDHFLLKSPAWGSLSPNGKAVLIDVWSRHNSFNNGLIIYAVRDSAAAGIKRDAASRALAECIDRGFLRVTRQASFNTKNREARTWTITAEPVGDVPATKDFMRWMPPQSASSDCRGNAKSRTQSVSSDVQSGQSDCEAPQGNDLASDGPCSRTVGADIGPSQSVQPDTSKLPYLSSLQRSTSRDENRAENGFGPAPIITTAAQMSQLGGDE